LEVIRYINNQKLRSGNPANYVVDSDVILETIARVNARLNQNLNLNREPKKISDIGHIYTKAVEIN